MGRNWDTEEDDDTLPAYGRSQKAEFFVYDTEPFWAAIKVWVGSPYSAEYFEFPLTRDPIPDLKQLYQDICNGKPAHVRIYGEPGGLKVRVDPDEPEGWVRIAIWWVNYADVRTLAYEAICPADVLAKSMREKSKFLAEES